MEPSVRVPDQQIFRGHLSARIDRDLVGGETPDDAKALVPPDRLHIPGEGGPGNGEVDGHIISTMDVEVASEVAKQLTLTGKLVAERTAQAQILLDRLHQRARAVRPGQRRAISIRARSSTLA